MKKIPLTQGRYALVDDADFEWLSQWKWRLAKRFYTSYAVRTDYTTKPQREILMHREILKPPKGLESDHKNGYGLDNRRENLRSCTHAENHQNQKKHTGKFKGITPIGKKWKAQIEHNCKNLHLGQYSNQADAARAYDKAAVKYFGEFARLNFPKESK